MSYRNFILGVFLAVSTAFGSAVAQQGIIKIVVPFAAGGGTDIYVRMLAEEMTKRGTRVIVENKPGAASSLPTMWPRRSPTDRRC